MAVEVTGRSVATMRIAITVTTVRQLQEWAACWPQRRGAVEGAEGLGRGVAAGLASAGDQVVDVPAPLAARARLLNWRSCSQDRRAGRGLGGRSGGAPPAASRGARRGSQRGSAVVVGRRDDLAEERTRTVNRLPALLRDLVAGGAKRNLSATHAAGLLRTVRPMTPAEEHRKSLGQDLLADLRRLDRALRTNAAQIQAAVSVSKTTLTTLQGIGPVLAARAWATPVRAVDSRPDITTPATAGLHPSRPEAVTNADTASHGPITDNSTMRCTS